MKPYLQRILPLSLLLLWGTAGWAQGSGAIVGRVLDSEGHAVPRAEVVLAGTNLATVTDEQGLYRLGAVPAGEQTVLVSFLGFDSASATVQVEPGETVRQDVRLEPFGEELTVRASPILLGQAEALNRQKANVNITNVIAEEQLDSFPDPNAAEAIQRIPGIALERDQGEGRYVLVRGTEARLNSTTINGERVPSPEAGTRDIALDVIPADLLQAIEVSKALTPDMDGDAIGGAVNLVTKRAPESTRVSVSLGWGENEIVDDDIQKGSVTYGGRFGEENKLGLLVAGSLYDTNRGSHNFEAEYDDGFIGDFELRHYNVQRERYGANLALDYRASDRSEFFMRYIWNEYRDTEIRRRKRDRVGDGEIEREIKDRLQASKITSLTAGGVSQAGKAVVEYRVAWNTAYEDTPNGLDSVFLQEDVEFLPNVTPGSIDPNNIRTNPQNENLGSFVFDGAENYFERADEEDVVAAVDVSLPFFRSDGNSGLWKFGVKGRFKTKDQDNEIFDLEAEDDLGLAAFLEQWAPGSAFLDGRYDIGLFQSPGLLRQLLAAGMLEVEKNIEEDLADFTSDEDTLAAYGMAEVYLGPKLVLLGGVRVESTETSYVANELVFDEEGDIASVAPVSGGNDYTEVLPMVHMRQALTENSNLRVAVTRTLARPNFEDLAPFQLILQEDDEIVRGNPALQVTTAWNLDVLYERYLKPVGVIAAGVFHKELDDNIINFVDSESRDNRDFDVFQRRNGQGAQLSGFEFAFQNQLTSLPSPWDGLGVYLNFTLTDSEQTLQDRADTPLQGQPEELGNLAISYEKGGFSGSLAVNYHGEFIMEVGGDPSEDLWVDEHTQLDLQLRYQINPRWSLILEGINLDDEPFRVYEGVPSRPIQEEYYSRWWTLTAKWSR